MLSCFQMDRAVHFDTISIQRVPPDTQEFPIFVALLRSIKISLKKVTDTPRVHQNISVKDGHEITTEACDMNINCTLAET